MKNRDRLNSNADPFEMPPLPAFVTEGTGHYAAHDEGHAEQERTISPPPPHGLSKSAWIAFVVSGFS